MRVRQTAPGRCGTIIAEAGPHLQLTAVDGRRASPPGGGRSSAPSRSGSRDWIRVRCDAAIEVSAERVGAPDPAGLRGPVTSVSGVVERVVEASHQAVRPVQVASGALLLNDQQAGPEQVDKAVVQLGHVLLVPGHAAPLHPEVCPPVLARCTSTASSRNLSTTRAARSQTLAGSPPRRVARTCSTPG